MWYVKTILVIAANILAAESQDRFTDHEMIAEFVTKMESRPFVISVVCWQIEKKAAFIKLLSNYGISSAIINADHFIESIGRRGDNDLFLMDAECESTNKILDIANKYNLFRMPYKWIILSDRNLTELKEYDIYPDSDLTILPKASNNPIIQLYKTGKGGNLIYEHYGWWENCTIVDERPSTIISRRRKNLNRLPITMAIVVTNNDSLNHLTDRINQHVDAVSKTSYVLTSMLGDIANCSLNEIHSNLWGWMGGDGKWQGMMGQVVSGEAEIGSTPLYIIKERIGVVDFLWAPIEDQTSFVFRRPPLSQVENLFALPFSRFVWGSCGLLLLLMCFILYAILQRERHPNQHWSDAYLIAIGAVFQQAPTQHFKSLPGRLSIITIFVSLMFLYTSYSASIVALLQSTTNSINTISDLLHSNLKLGAEDTVYNRKYFSTANDPIRETIYNTKISPPSGKSNFISVKEGVRKIRQGSYAFYMHLGTGYKLMEETYYEYEKCNLQEIKYFDFSYPHNIVRRNSPYKEIFKIGMKRIYEVGLQKREYFILYKSKPKCTENNGNFVSVSLGDFRPPLLWLVYGITASIIVFTIEYANARLRIITIVHETVSIYL